MDSRFGPYRLGRLLGRGGFGEVYEATDTEKNRIVALKLVAAAYSQDEAFRQRLFREASTAGRLHEPHVVPIHSYGEIDGQLYIDMRLVSGTDLQNVLAEGGALAPDRTVWVVRQIASALDAAHAAGLVHRDVKPANILLTGEDFAYLVDFGIANAASDTKLTGTGTTIGTLAYMAPERFTRTAEVDHRADVYALTCVLFECLTGRQPYSGSGDLPALMGAHLNAPIPRPSQHGPHLPAGLDAVVAKGMAKSPADRYQSAGELAAAAQSGLSAPGADSVDTMVATAQAATIAPTQAGHRPDSAAAGWPGVPTPAAQRAPQGPGRWVRRRAIVGGGLVAVVLATAGVVSAVGLTRRDSSTGHQTTPPSAQHAAPPASPIQPANSRQSVLPFTDLDVPRGIAVDAAGTVYVTDGQRVEKLAAGAMPVELALPTPADQPQDVAVDAEGNVYVATDLNFRVLKLGAGSSDWAELPFANLWSPEGLAVDAAGSVYVTDGGLSQETQQLTGRLVRLSAGSNEESVLKSGSDFHPVGVAVDAAGGILVADESNSRVVKLESGSSRLTVLPFTGLHSPHDVAVDAAGNIFVADTYGNRVLKLSVGSSSPTTLPLTGLNLPLSVAVDPVGNVYVADSRNNRVLKLAAD